MKQGISAKLHIRLMCAVMALVMLVSLLPAWALPVQAASQGKTEENSLLYNGSFDLPYTDAQTVSGWNLNVKNTNHTVIIQSSVVYGDSGNALKIEATGQSYIWATDFSVESGATYLLSYRVRVDAADGLQFAPFLNDSNYSGGWWKDYVTQPVSAVTDGWERVYALITIPESVGANANNPSSKVQLGFKVYQGSGTVYLDHVSFVKTDIYLDDPNLDFETAISETDAPANWNASIKQYQTLTLQSDTSVYHSGTQSMHIYKDSLLEKSTVESTVYLPVDPANIYEFSFWMCSQNASPTATVRMDLQLYAEDGSQLCQEDGSYQIVQGTVAALNSGSERSGWTKVVTRAAPPEGAAYAVIRFTLTRGTAEVWLDDIFFEVVEDGTDCVVYYEDFHAVDESGNISHWQLSGNGKFAADNGGKLTVSGEAYIYNEMTCLMTDYTYCVKGNYTADIGGTAQLRFYDYQHSEYLDQRVTVPLQAGGSTFAINVTAPSNTYAALYIGSDQAGTVTTENVTVYMTAQPKQPNVNNTDPAWTSSANRDNVVSSVQVYNGTPTLMIDGEPTAAYFYLRPDLDAYLRTDAESRISESGLELYVTYGGNLYKGGCDPIWLEDGSVDYDAFDAVIYETLAASDDALVMVNIGMFAPQWWLEQNPEHQAQAHNGSSYIALNDVSLASEKFRQEAGEVLRLLISHMKEQSYYNRVFGLKISGGQSYEWMCLGTGSDQGPDYSQVSQEGFRAYLQSKYGTVEALQAAWGSDTVTFETATAPGWDARTESSNVYMGDADTGSLSRNMVDWNLWLNEASADSFLYYCQIAKEETDGQIIVGGYNGYLWTSNTYDSQGKAHTAMDRVLDSEYVDWIASPIAYNERLLGQSSTYMALIDSVQAHGKLYIAEQDNRTCLSDSYAGTSWDASWDYSVGQTRTVADTVYQQKRDFANALVGGVGLWQYDMYGGWLDDDQLYGYFSDAKAEYDLSVYLDRNQRNEVAVFVGDETYAYLTAENGNMSYTLLEPMLMQQRKHLAAMGAGYDTYAMSSLLDGKVSPHKLNIILSPFELTEQMHTAIDTYLKTDGQVVVWVYLPGISTGTELSLSNVQRATGFSVGIVEEKSTLQVQLANTDHSLTEGIEGLVYGNSTPNSVSPLTYIKDTADVTVLGYNVDGLKLAGLGIKDMGDWMSVYSSAPCLDVQLLRKLLELAGCHIYSDNNADIIYSNNHYVALHSAAAGEKTISLPGNYSVYDVFEEQFISMDTNTITYYHEANDTHIFRLMPPNTYAVTARIKGGKGTLSAPGLTEVTPGSAYSLCVIPEPGYAVSKVSVNGETAQLNTVGILRLGAVNENTVIEVTFQKKALIENGDFETGSFSGSVTGSGAQIVSDETVYSGSYSLHLNHDGTARDLVTATVYPTASDVDRQITVSYWAKTAVGATRALHTSAAFFKADWTRTQNPVYGAVYPSRSQWQMFTATLTLPAGTDIFQYQFYTDSANASVYVDDISIVCDGYPLMINGGLERGNLGGSFTASENSPTVIKTAYAHTGTYAAHVVQGDTVTATVTDLSLEEDTQMALSYWLRIPETATATSACYGISYGDAGGQWSSPESLSGVNSVAADGAWHKQQLIFTVPAGTTAVQIQIYAQGSGAQLYLDDLYLEFMPAQALPQVTLAFQEIYSDGTWRLTAEDMSLFTEKYYKLPAVLDGEDGYVVANNLTSMLCVYPSFFSVYGGSVPATSFVIPEGAVIKPVDPNTHWGELENGTAIQTAQELKVVLTPAYVKAWNLTLGGDLTVNFYMNIPESLQSTAQVVISVADQTYIYAVADAPYDAGEQGYRFSIHIAAAQMNDTICVQTVCNGEAVSTENYTVQQYARYVLADNGMSSYHPLVREMLHYGAAAQTYFDYNADNLVNEGITNAGTEEIPAAADWEMSVEGAIEGIRFYGASLLFGHKIAVRYYFAVSSELEDCTFAANGIACKAVMKDGLWYVELPGINPQDWDDVIELTACDADGNCLTVCYSPMNYIVRMNAKGSSSLKELLKAMYNYHLAAEAICADAGPL